MNSWDDLPKEKSDPGFWWGLVNWNASDEVYQDPITLNLEGSNSYVLCIKNEYLLTDFNGNWNDWISKS